MLSDEDESKLDQSWSPRSARLSIICLFVVDLYLVLDLWMSTVDGGASALGMVSAALALPCVFLTLAVWRHIPKDNQRFQ